MGLLRNIKHGRAAMKLQSAFVDLYDAASAYRPPVSSPNQRQQWADPVRLLHRLSDHANGLGLTAGDVGVLAVELLSQIDEQKSYADAFDAVMGFVADGSLLTVDGKPMRNFAQPDGVAQMLEMIAVGARMEAYAEYIDGEFELPDTSARPADRDALVRQLQNEYAYLTAEAVLSSEAERAAAILRQLELLGADPDEALNERVRRELGGTPPTGSR